MEKKRTFILHDEGIGENVIVGDVQSTLDYIQSYLTEAKNGEKLNFAIWRDDMTEAEMDAAPEI